MNDNLKKMTRTFFFIAIGFSWPFMFAVDAWLGPYFHHQNNNDLANLIVLIGHGIAMLGPAVAALVVWKVILKQPLPQWKWSKPKHYLLAALFFIATWGLPGAIGIFMNKFHLDLSISQPMMNYMLVYVLLIWFSGMGEEIGWCSFLLTYLPKHIGKTRAIIVSGLLRGIWHLPVLIGYPIYQTIMGEKTVSALVIITVVFCIQLMVSNVFFGAFFALIWSKTKSIPFIGWAHFMTDLARDFLVIFIIGYMNNATFMMLAQLPVFMIGSIYLLNTSREEGINSFKKLLNS